MPSPLGPTTCPVKKSKVLRVYLFRPRLEEGSFYLCCGASLDLKILHRLQQWGEKRANIGSTLLSSDAVGRYGKAVHHPREHSDHSENLLRPRPEKQ